MTPLEWDAYMYAGEMAAEYTREIGKTDLASLTGEEFLTFCEVMCKNYHHKYIDNNS